MLVLRVRAPAAASAPSQVVALLRKMMLPDVYPCRQTMAAAMWYAGGKVRVEVHIHPASLYPASLWWLL